MEFVGSVAFAVCILALRLLQQFNEFLGGYPRLLQNCMKCLRCQLLSAIRHGHPASSLRMFENIMATTSTMNHETGSHQSLYGFLAAYPWQLQAVTSTTASSTVSSVGTDSPSTLRLSI